MDPRAEPPSDAAHDPHYEEHGHTAEDEGGVGHGPEGFRAEEYPGHNPLQGESERELAHRTRYTWRWPRVETEESDEAREVPQADRDICLEIGRRIVQAEPDLTRVVVHVQDGAVHLEGDVASDDDRNTVESLARHVEGVRRVRSLLAVRP